MKHGKPDWTTLDWGPINRLHDAIIIALQRHDGRLWKESLSELHAPNLELPVWILLYEDGDVEKAHLEVQKILEPHLAGLGPVNCTLSYTILTETEEIQVDFLDGNAEIAETLDKRPLGARPMVDPRSGSGIFRSDNSRR